MGTVRDSLELPDMRRIELGYGLSIAGELAGTVALVVYALGAGGGALVAALPPPGPWLAWRWRWS